ncbi:carbohydrate ABC transporter permease [Streptantibioticus cattleyicolor]|uniref:Binding-protein-dependent transport systems inner membrane component n=1 Tax=Streptantibioticus cattleyicolor (strain ATCC 35852 / DSM 46488 / JCM 4925 / NBRC 14057 / NRRL 8057) TaxID=1003195 RepID=F8JJ00_STREN|nr:carbohydrate ABC transporter permease [Streptantibioticus cattleyicolor]AEW98910.1 binding-protein-dependent transport systems inner membrane component [Streptantibioticus cattleyicolor NRRL 8057 = DSM 46488]CCB72043.1 Carbohydrate ABC transporter membrane protein 2, CUT1 family [Streptantibioticus cattleyicolor NRRL 8057 = DSM 46488]
MTITRDQAVPPAAPATRPVTRRRSRTFGRLGPAGITARYAGLLVVLAITVGPLLWELSTSLKSVAEDVFTTNPSFLPAHPTFHNYQKVAHTIPVWHFAANSLVVAVLGVGGNVVGASVAGFALARLEFRGRRLVYGLFLSTLVLPGEVTIISQYQTVTRLGLADSLLGVALPGMIGALNVLLMRNAFLAIPAELDAAAAIDGANAWQRLWHIGLPAVRGTLSVIAILSFIGAWDDFLWPLLVLNSPDKLTLTVGLAYLQSTFSVDPRTIAAGAMIALLPILVLFVAVQRYFFKGVGEGAVKG